MKMTLKLYEIIKKPLDLLFKLINNAFAQDTADKTRLEHAVYCLKTQCFLTNYVHLLKDTMFESNEIF